MSGINGILGGHRNGVNSIGANNLTVYLGRSGGGDSCGVGDICIISRGDGRGVIFFSGGVMVGCDDGAIGEGGTVVVCPGGDDDGCASSFPSFCRWMLHVVCLCSLHMDAAIVSEK